MMAYCIGLSSGSSKLPGQPGSVSVFENHCLFQIETESVITQEFTGIYLPSSIHSDTKDKHFINVYNSSISLYIQQPFNSTDVLWQITTGETQFESSVANAYTMPRKFLTINGTAVTLNITLYISNHHFFYQVCQRMAEFNAMSFTTLHQLKAHGDTFLARLTNVTRIQDGINAELHAKLSNLTQQMDTLKGKMEAQETLSNTRHFSIMFVCAITVTCCVVIGIVILICYCGQSIEREVTVTPAPTQTNIIVHDNPHLTDHTRDPEWVQQRIAEVKSKQLITCPGNDELFSDVFPSEDGESEFKLDEMPHAHVYQLKPAGMP
eukprot:116001_1